MRLSDRSLDVLSSDLSALLGPGIADRVRRLRALLVSVVTVRRIGPFGDLLTFLFPVRGVPALVVGELLVLSLREGEQLFDLGFELAEQDRKSTRLNSSH